MDMNSLFDERRLILSHCRVEPGNPIGGDLNDSASLPWKCQGRVEDPLRDSGVNLHLTSLYWVTGLKLWQQAARSGKEGGSTQHLRIRHEQGVHLRLNASARDQTPMATHSRRFKRLRAGPIIYRLPAGTRGPHAATR